MLQEQKRKELFLYEPTDRAKDLDAVRAVVVPPHLPGAAPDLHRCFRRQFDPVLSWRDRLRRM
jgi:hypothetical protein